MIPELLELRRQGMYSLRKTYWKISGAHPCWQTVHALPLAGINDYLKKDCCQKIHNKWMTISFSVRTFTEFSCQCFYFASASDKLEYENKTRSSLNWRCIRAEYCAVVERPGSGETKSMGKGTFVMELKWGCTEALELSSTCLHGYWAGKQSLVMDSKLGKNQKRQAQTVWRSCPNIREQGDSV